MALATEICDFQRGIHNIEHQITYSGSNFIFHDSQGFEAGAGEEMDAVWDFIEEKSSAFELRDQLHAIWYSHHDINHVFVQLINI